MGITAEDVVASIEMILGWTPDAALVDYHLGLGFRNREELGRYMVSTDEFRQKFEGETADFGSWAGKAAAAKNRKKRLMSFGPHAYGLLVRGTHGLFAVDPEDNSVTAALLATGEYAEHELALASAFLTSSSSSVLLVGAHVGALAVPLSRCCAHMEAVEANPATQILLEANFRLNNCNNVVLHKFAASDKHEQIPFLINRENSGGSKRKPLLDQPHYLYDEPEQVLIDALPLDEVCSGKTFNLIFMDIEGSEFFALKGMQNILSHADALCVEFLPHHLKDVAGVGIEEFGDQIEPHFSWLYVPERRVLIEKTAIRQELRSMYDRNEGSDGLYFLNSLPSAWLDQAGVSLPE